jgi:hypothetical protein
VISVHNYLYANPVGSGLPPSALDRKPRNVSNFLDALTKGLRVPLTQIAHLSDAAARDPRPPLKPVIQKTLTDFLESSRRQDRVLVFFIGHAVELGGEPYLVPIEGELDNASTLLPLPWVYQQLEKCRARQKVLVLDVDRFNPTLGLERPGGGPLGAKFDAALKAPPPGVQVWSACVAKQLSYETDQMPMGAFLDELWTALAPTSPRQGLEGKIQRPDDPLPLGPLNELVNRGLQAELGPQKLEQVARVSGGDADNGAAYDRDEPLPPSPVLAPYVRSRENRDLAHRVLDKEIGAPPVKVSLNDLAINYDLLPPFAEEALKPYEEAGDPNSPLQQVVHRARVALWAVSASGEPAELAAEVRKVRAEVKVDLSVMRDGYRAPAGGAGETRFKAQILDDERKVADILLTLNEALEELKAAGAGRGQAPKRWQANYDFMLARVQAQIAYLYEYQSMLGQMRKEFPRRDPALHGGWRLAAQTELTGDATGKRLARNARKLLDQLIGQHRGTPWEVLAKREKLTALGLEWKPAR